MDRAVESDRTSFGDFNRRLSTGDVVVQAAKAAVTNSVDGFQRPTSTPADGSPTLCDLFARTASRTPNALALCDPPNKLRLTGQPAACLSYAEADRAIASLAMQMTNTGLPTGSIVAVQMANTIEYPLILLAAWRAGLVVALLPQLWRQAELTEALNRLGARALVVSSRIEIIDHADLAMNAAAEVFSIRHVFGFGSSLPDGMTPLDWTIEPVDTVMPSGISARRAAIASFDVTKDGMIAIPRSHLNLIAGGLAISMQSGVPQGAKILSTMLPSSFAGLVSSVVLWLLTGGSLSLHHPFDPACLDEQIRADQCDTLVVPGQLALRMSEAQTIDAQPTLRHVIGLWRTPERVASSTDWGSSPAVLTDVYLFGEMGLFALNRILDGSAAPITLGVTRSPEGTNIGELLLTPQGTLALRGPSAALAAYREPPRQEQSLLTAPAEIDYVDTGYAARRAGTNGTVQLTATPPNIASVGGYRFRNDDLDQWARRLPSGTVLMAVPDQLNGFRIAGRSGENARARGALSELGLNPLMTEAFRQRESSNPD
ncbi:MAG: acyl--CoA ligase [Xanthobacteraceae bacterium]|nr:acyl--CoA ligase [Xanthobacteraceae bacterium]